MKIAYRGMLLLFIVKLQVIVCEFLEAYHVDQLIHSPLKTGLKTEQLTAKKPLFPDKVFASLAFLLMAKTIEVAHTGFLYLLDWISL